MFIVAAADSMRLSIITAVFNRVGTLSDTLDSVQSQSGVDVEQVVIDGASTDGSVQILESRRKQLAVLVSERDRGIYDALNKGIARASGAVVGFLHADDVYAQTHVLAKVAQAFDDAVIDAAYGDLVYVRADDTSNIVRHWRAGPFSRRRLALGVDAPHPTLYVRRQWYECIGGFDTRYRIAADYCSILNLFCQPGFRPAYIPEVLVKMRLGGASNRSLSNILRKSREDYDALCRTGVGGLGALTWKNISKLGQFH